MREAAHLQAGGHCGQGLVQKGLEALSCLLGVIWVAAESRLELQRECNEFIALGECCNLAPRYRASTEAERHTKGRPGKCGHLELQGMRKSLRMATLMQGQRWYDKAYNRTPRQLHKARSWNSPHRPTTALLPRPDCSPSAQQYCSAASALGWLPS